MCNNNKENPEYMGVYTRREFQRVYVHHELVCLAVFVTRWAQCEQMGLSDAYRMKRCRKQLQRMLGGPEGFGWLQEKLNREMNGILDRLKRDIPGITHLQLLVFSYSAAGFTNDLTAFLAGLKSPMHASVIRNRLRERIIQMELPDCEEYLALLPKKGCRIGEEMMYLQSRKYRKLWKNPDSAAVPYDQGGLD